MNRVVIFGVAGLVLTVGAPLYLASQLQLGTNAKSPQMVDVALGSSVLIGGGRGKLWFAGGNSGGDFEIQCSKEQRYVSPEPGKVYEGCRMRVSLVQVKPGEGLKPPRGVFRVEW